MKLPPVSPEHCYSIDTSALIHAWTRAYRPQNFGRLWANFDQIIAGGRMRASIEVFREVARLDDDLHAWCKDRKSELFVEVSEECDALMSVIMRDHPRLVDTVKGRSAADPFVIALAGSQAPRGVVITEEHPGKVRIPDVCAAMRLRCMSLADMIEVEGWQF